MNEEDELNDVCLTNPDRDNVLGALNAFASGHSGRYADIARAYCSNVDGLFSVASLPFTLARHGVTIQEYQKLCLETELDMVAEGDILPSSDRKVRATARSLDALEARCGTSQGKQRLASQSRAFLTAMLRTGGLRSAAQNLLRQGLVLGWAAFEVAARDTFVAFLNQRPAACKRLLGDPSAKRRFDVSKISIDTLIANDFDLSDKMGTLLSSSQDLSDLTSMKAAFSPLFESSKVDQALASEELRALGQKRHLVVHRCGVVDTAFARSVKCQQGAGETLLVTPDELVQHVAAASVACLALLEAAQGHEA